MPSRMETVLSALFVTARLNFPPPVRSATATANGAAPAARSKRVSDTEVVGLVMGKKTGLDVPPPGVGFKTVIAAVAAAAMSDAPIAAVSSELLTNVVGLGLPFQVTIELETKLLPVTVNINPAPPGTALAGTSG